MTAKYLTPLEYLKKPAYKISTSTEYLFEHTKDHNAQRPSLKTTPSNEHIFAHKQNNTNNSNNNNQKKNSEMIQKEIEKRDFLKFVNKELKNKENKIKRNFTTKVELYVCFLKIGEIENIKQKFQADVYIGTYTEYIENIFRNYILKKKFIFKEACWEDNSIEGDTFDTKKHWTPDLYIENTSGAPKQDIKYKIIKKGKSKIVCEMRKASGTFYETLELNDFPLGKYQKKFS